MNEPNTITCFLYTNSGLINETILNAVQPIEGTDQLKVLGVIVTDRIRIENKSGLDYLGKQFQLAELNWPVPLFTESEFVQSGIKCDFILCNNDALPFFHGSFNCPLGYWRFLFLEQGNPHHKNLKLLMRNKSINATLLLSNNLDHLILREAHFRIYRNSSAKTFAKISFELSLWISIVLKTKSTLRPKSFVSSEIENHVNNSSLTPIYLWLHSIRFKLAHAFRLLFQKEVWNIGIIKKPISQSWNANFLSEIVWLKPPVNGIKADPFGIRFENKLVLFYEDLKFNSATGKIVREEFDENLVSVKKSDMINDNRHHSYPFIITDNGNTYMLPECSESGIVQLFKLSEDGMSITGQYVLKENYKAVDSTLIFYHNKWWLFCTRKDDSPDLKLHILHSDNLTGPYQEHMLNPVKIDISGSRPAGTMYIKDDVLYRPAQDSSFSYGDCIHVFKIVRLSDDEFEEAYSHTLSPAGLNSYNRGLHTMSSVGDYTIIDAKKVQWTLNMNWMLKPFKKY